MLEKLRRLLRYNLKYLGNPTWDTGISPPELINFLENHAPGRGLDVGCGTGTNLLTMAEYGWHVAGMDIALLPVLKARKKLCVSGYQTDIVMGSATGKRFDKRQFDFVLDIGCFHSLNEKDRELYRGNLQRWLATGGHFLIYAHYRPTPTTSRGVSNQDFEAFGSFLRLQWLTDQNENSPNASSGRPSVWAQFQHTA